jgi:molybdopterin-synthase adenylyltransferase
MNQLKGYLRDHASGEYISWNVQMKAAGTFGVSAANVEEVALEAGLLPLRYLRNQKTISTAQQLVLFRSRVAVAGCGGLGGYLIEELARLGVGQLLIFDPDVFAEHNLNRQIFSSISLIGQSKTEAAVSRVREINPSLTLTACNCPFEAPEIRDVFQGVSVVADGLDSIPARLELAKLCDFLAIPLVHGAIGGWYGQVTTQFPGDRTVQELYECSSQKQGIEKMLGNPSYTPAVVASIQAAEVCKILLGLGNLLRRRLLTINLLDMEFNELTMGDVLK